MKVSLNWANWHSKMDLVPKGLGVLVKKIGDQLGEIEEVVKYAECYENVYVVKIVSCERHPNADKLSLCLVDDNGTDKKAKRDKKGLVQVVCGAPNVKKGMLAAWIPPGQIVPSTYGKDPFKLEARKIRGEVSNGMLASPSELGISDEHDGILEVSDKKAKPGVSLKELYGLNDVVVDIENKMFTHRPDCFGVLGVARELAGIQGMSFKSPDWYVNVPKFENAKGLSLEIENQTPMLVPRFMAVAMSGVNVRPSPTWLQAGLRRVGIKPINNVVDITNYLMYVTGQPLHAYDYDKVAEKSKAGAVLSVRYPKKGEKLKLLGGKVIEPRKEAIMIATDKELIGIGGVMGGADTEVSSQTKNIILECANFDLYSIRKTSMEHGLFTDAVTRFSKGQSPLQNSRVLAKAMELIIQESGAKQASNVIDKISLESEAFKRDALHEPVTVQAEFINSRLGLDLSAEEMAAILRNTEFVAEITRGSNLVVKAPFWRTDIKIAEDIVEEVGRLYGYDHLPQELPVRTAVPVKREESLAFKFRLRGILAALGANETLNYSFVHGKLLNNALQDPANSYKINNALSPDLQYYRQSLTPSLLGNVYPNIRAGSEQFALFEINKVHHKKTGLTDEKVPVEMNRIALVYAAKKQKGAAYFAVRAYLDELAKKLGLKLEYLVMNKKTGPMHQPYNTARSALVKIAGEANMLGIVGEFDQDAIENFKLPVFSAGFEVDLEVLMQAAKQTGSGYAPLSKYPSISQDICLRVVPKTSFKEVEGALNQAVHKSKPEDVECQISLLDIYSPQKGNYKNITFSVSIYSYERTLTEEVATKLLDKTAQKVAKEIGAKKV